MDTQKIQKNLLQFGVNIANFNWVPISRKVTPAKVRLTQFRKHSRQT
jgi:hypothetical protein